MYVDIDVGGVHVEVDEVRHLLAGRHESLVSTHHRLMKIGVFHVALVGKEVLMSVFFACRFGLTHKAGNLAQCGIYVERQQLLIGFSAEDVDDALPPVGGRQAEELHLIAVHGEGYVGIYQGYALKGREDVVELGGV